MGIGSYSVCYLGVFPVDPIEVLLQRSSSLRMMEDGISPALYVMTIFDLKSKVAKP